MTGVVVDVLVDGEVIRTESNNRALLDKIERDRSSAGSH